MVVVVIYAIVHYIHKQIVHLIQEIESNNNNNNKIIIII